MRLRLKLTLLTCTLLTLLLGMVTLSPRAPRERVGKT